VSPARTLRWSTLTVAGGMPPIGRSTYGEVGEAPRRVDAMDVTTIIVVGVAPSIVVLGAGVCRASWVWLREQVLLAGTEPRARRSRI